MAKKRTANDFPHKKLAKITATMLGFEDHGILTAMIHVDYGEGVAQGLGGWALDEWSEKHGRRIGHVLCGEFVAGILKACGVERWEKLKGRTVYALFMSDAWSATAIGIAPLPTEEGEVFIFKEVAEEAVARSKSA